MLGGSRFLCVVSSSLAVLWVGCFSLKPPPPPPEPTVVPLQTEEPLPEPDHHASEVEVSPQDDEALRLALARDHTVSALRAMVAAGASLALVGKAVSIWAPGQNGRWFAVRYDVEEVLFGQLGEGAVTIDHPTLKGLIAFPEPVKPEVGRRYVVIAALSENQEAPFRLVSGPSVLAEVAPGQFFAPGWGAPITVSDIASILAGEGQP